MASRLHLSTAPWTLFRQHLTYLAASLDNFQPKVLLALIVPPLLATTVFTLARGYASWLQAGQGGVPPSPIGYSIHLLIRAITCLQPNLRDVAPYSQVRVRKLYKAPGQTSYLCAPLPRRQGPPEVTLPWTVPQRQATGNQAGLRDLQARVLRDLVAKYEGQVVLATSALEKHGSALFLAPGLPRAAWQQGMSKGELAHWHLDAEGSGHAMLSLDDAREVLEKGWGERHALSGMVIPWGYVMLFAPRDEDEVRILQDIMESAIRFGVNAGRQAAESND